MEEFALDFLVEFETDDLSRFLDVVVSMRGLLEVALWLWTVNPDGNENRRVLRNWAIAQANVEQKLEADFLLATRMSDSRTSFCPMNNSNCCVHYAR